ncbi:MAG: substrate-binding domain-containing protein, partial [Phycisphaeraceae bacterium JB051]
RPVVVLDQDVSAHDVSSLRLSAPAEIPILLRSLEDAGHQRVACLNTQPLDNVIRERIDQWQFWIKMHNLDGCLIDEHVKPFESAMQHAYQVLCERLESGDFTQTAIFCTTGIAAIGAMRALTDHGLEPGRDVAVCAADSNGDEAPYLRPSMTCLRSPDVSPYVEACLDWFAGGAKQWIGPRLIHPPRVDLFTGESTSEFTLPDR